MRIEITQKDKKNNYKRVKKYKDDKNIKIYSRTNDDELQQAFIKAFNQKNIEKRYSYIYDYMCNYLDKNINVLCDFKNDKCIANRLGKSVRDINGCCYLHKTLCTNLKCRQCSLPNLSCKLFMCEYAEKNLLKFKSLPKNYLLIDYFFNRKQKNFIQRFYRQEKQLAIKKLLELQ